MKKKKYVSPELTVVSFRTEVGYAASGEVVDKLAGHINGQVQEFQLQYNEGWGVTEVSGNTTGDGDQGGEGITNGLAAGYFTEQSTDGWFN